MACSKPAGPAATEAYAVGTPQGDAGPRTKLQGIFSSVSMAQFGAGSIGAHTDQPKSDELLAMWALGPDGIFVQVFEIALLEPHQLEAAWTRFDLRHQHSFQYYAGGMPEG
jgi:hypothetical protein